MSILKVEGHRAFVKDTSSNGVINTDASNAYNTYKTY